MMKNIFKFKQWTLGAVVVVMLGIGWACTDEDAPENIAPGFQDYVAKNVMRTTATLSGKLSGNTALVKEYGFQYSYSNNFPADQTTNVKVGDGSPSGSFSIDLTGLRPNQVYYFRMYASTGASTVYSTEEVFNTPNSTAPTFKEHKVDSIGENYIKITCQIDQIGDEYLIEYGVGYKTGLSETYTPVMATSFIDEENMIYTVEIADLEPETTYSFRPYAKNSSDADSSEGNREGYGTIFEETTDELLAPDVETEIIASSGINSITVSGKVLSAVGSNGELTDCGFVYSSENQRPRLELNDASVSVMIPEEFEQNFVETIVGLKPNVTYYVCAYAKNIVDGKERVGYGEAIPVTTTTLVKPSINEVTYEVTSSSIILQATIANCDENALKEKGFVYDRSKEITVEEAIKNNTIIKTLAGTGTFTDTIPDLEMNTSYRVRAYAIYEAEGVEPVIGYSTRTYDIYTSGFEAPSVGFEMNHDKVTRNSAEFVGKIHSNGNGVITERGFVYIESSVTYEPTLTHKGVYKLVSDDSFVSIVKGLEYSTDYAVRSYTISKLEEKVDTTYSGGWNTFRTKSVVPPTFNNVNLSDDTYRSFKATCGISNLGDGKLLEKGFYYKKDDSDFSTGKDSIIVKSDAFDEFSAEITGVDYSSRYYVVAYAKEEVDGVTVLYTSDTRSIWTPNPSSSSFGEIKLEDATYKSVKATSGINELGDGKLLEKGFYYTTIPWDFSQEKDSVIVESDSIEVFSTVIDGLKYNTDYYVCAYAKKDLGGEIEIYRSGATHVWIPNPTGTSFGELKADSATYYSFIVSGTINDMGDGKVLEKGFYWRADGVEYVNGYDSIAVKSGTNEEYAAVIDNLQSERWHYVGQYTKMDVDGSIFIHRSGYNSSIWVPAPIWPSFNFNTDGSVYKQLKLTAIITSEGDGEVYEKGFCWRKVGEDDWEHPTLDLNDGKIVFEDTISSFEHTIKDLEPEKEYYSRAYAKVKFKNGEKIVFSSTHGRTLSTVELPYISNWFDINDQTRNSVVVTARLDNDGNGEITHRGFVISDNAKNPLPAIGDCDKKWDDVDETFTKTLTGLKHHTEYALRAFVVTSFDGVADTIYNDNARTFWTSSVQLPEFKRPTFDKVELNSFTVSSVITSMGEGTLKEKGFCWNRVTSDFDLNTETTNSQVVTGDSLYLEMKDLEANTTYYMKAYAKVEIDGVEYTAYSNQASKSTSSYNHASLNNTKVDSEKTTRNSAFLSGTFGNTGNGTIVEKGFVLSKTSVTSEPTLENNIKKIVANDDFTATVTGLDWNTEYAVRSYAICKWEASNFEETVYSSWRSTFRTKNVEYPKFNNVVVDSLTYSSFKVASGIGSLGDGEGALVEKGFIWLHNKDNWDSPTFDTYTGFKKVESDSINSYSLKIDSLLPGQPYAVCSYAKVTIDGKEAVGYSGTYHVNTASLNVNVWVNSLLNSCEVEAEFTEEADNVKGVYVNVAEQEGENADKFTKFTLTKDETTGRYKGVVDGLKENTNYYIQFYYVYAGNDVHHGNYHFTTKRSPSINDNVSPGTKVDE